MTFADAFLNKDTVSKLKKMIGVNFQINVSYNLSCVNTLRLSVAPDKSIDPSIITSEDETLSDSQSAYDSVHRFFNYYIANFANDTHSDFWNNNRAFYSLAVYAVNEADEDDRHLLIETKYQNKEKFLKNVDAIIRHQFLIHENWM